MPTPSPVLDLVADELGRMVSRLRSIGAPRLGQPCVPPFPTRADAVRHLVRELVTVADDTLPHGVPPRFDDVLLGDQLAVIGSDALAGLRSAPDGSSAAVLVLGELVLHRFDLDGTLPKGEAARVLAGGDDLVARLRERCPAG